LFKWELKGRFERRKKDEKIFSLPVNGLSFSFQPFSSNSFFGLRANVQGIESPSGPSAQFPIGFSKSGGL
jgi:hypothetical protein